MIETIKVNNRVDEKFNKIQEIMYNNINLNNMGSVIIFNKIDNYEYNIINTNENITKTLREVDNLITPVMVNSFTNILDYIFLNHLKIKYSELIAFGRTDEVNNAILKRFIKFIYTTNKTCTSIATKNVEKVRIYQCFHFNRFKDENVIFHEDYSSSWNCLIKEYNIGDYCIIFKKEIDV